MKIGFLGAGKVGTSLGQYFIAHNITVSGYYSKSVKSAEDAARYTKTAYFSSVEELIDSCNVLFLTVPDGMIQQVYGEIAGSIKEGMTVVHCSGALSTEVFEICGGKKQYYLSLHPLMAISSKETSVNELEKCFFTIEGNDDTQIEKWIGMFHSMGNKIIPISKENKVKYHAAATIASNLVTGLIDMSQQLLFECGFKEEQAQEALAMLVLKNVENVISMGTTKSLTGAVERQDMNTVHHHMEILTGEQREIYRLLSKQLITIAKKKHPDREYVEMEKILETSSGN